MFFLWQPVCKPKPTQEKIMDLQDIMRKYFRISVSGNETVSIKINNVPYDVIDVGNPSIVG